jgi:hypothetical protein
MRGFQEENPYKTFDLFNLGLVTPLGSKVEVTEEARNILQ